ncbi:hypothetical protein MAIC_40970 [Mycolicibacterium aichiense]|uniref:Uncharacterized protein n=1 Tax=Mycolicibacterium aichiense TaxID=1799 RepID=A0AAD1HQV1_9MYCO|nr:hypothetical protein MAIC_40970 [Mycolicibacterium aichiense]
MAYWALYHWHISLIAVTSAAVTLSFVWSYGKGNFGAQLEGVGVMTGSGLINELSDAGPGMGISALGSAPAGDPVTNAIAHTLTAE